MCINIPQYERNRQSRWLQTNNACWKSTTYCSSLSHLSRQSFELLTDLPSMLTVLEEDFQLEYIESYTDNVHGEPTIEGYEYCMGLKRAFESLISERYRSFILTVGWLSWVLVTLLIMTILKCFTHMLEMFMVKVML